MGIAMTSYVLYVILLSSIFCEGFIGRLQIYSTSCKTWWSHQPLPPPGHRHEICLCTRNTTGTAVLRPPYHHCKNNQGIREKLVKGWIETGIELKEESSKKLL